ncbi:MAG: glycosyltransferase family A protein [Candidatus Woesebacteria bacterium]|jgi:glycosyltransferase involved in cell wall biosynthesis
MKIKISIVILCKNQKDTVKKILDTIGKQTLKPLETIIVDSRSSDGSMDLYKKYKVKVINYQEKYAKFNYARALNTGVQTAKGNIIVRLSGDCVPLGKDWLKSISQDFNNPKIAGVYGKYLFSNKAHLYWRIIFNKFIYNEKKKYIRKRPIVLGGNFAFRKSLWEKRPFDEKIFYGEDVEFGFFILKENFELIYEPAVKSWHEHRGIKDCITRIYNDISHLLKFLKYSKKRGYYKYLF